MISGASCLVGAGAGGQATSFSSSRTTRGSSSCATAAASFSFFSVCSCEALFSSIEASVVGEVGIVVGPVGGEEVVPREEKVGEHAQSEHHDLGTGKRGQLRDQGGNGSHHD